MSTQKECTRSDMSQAMTQERIYSEVAFTDERDFEWITNTISEITNR